MELVDTHCHLNFRGYDRDRPEVLQRARAAGVSRIIIPGIDLDSCKQALELAASHSGIFAAVGIHPNSSVDFAESALESLRMLAEDPKVVALGEIGLDYHWDKSPKANQWRAFERQLCLASSLELPVIIHNREGRVDTAPSASHDLMALLEKWAPNTPASLKGRLGVLHSFSASADIAERALELGFYLGFTGPVTFKNAEDLREIARRAPVERLLVETDGPFLAPQQRRGKRNEPAYVRYINDKLAQLHGLRPEEMARRTSHNAERLFALPPG
ncbi:MAG: TatD family hydrolase [Chloroflexota bacterium]|nr:TatD family hydrolase [Chloroflexota bacterium]MDE2946597.1 TatD family hydrolase [Chloroflexota bacterium]